MVLRMHNVNRLFPDKPLVCLGLVGGGVAVDGHVEVVLFTEGGDGGRDRSPRREGGNDGERRCSGDGGRRR